MMGRAPGPDDLIAYARVPEPKAPPVSCGPEVDD
jgi:hypothetical protein